jgi:hypothetical protein
MKSRKYSCKNKTTNQQKKTPEFGSSLKISSLPKQFISLKVLLMHFTNLSTVSFSSGGAFSPKTNLFTLSIRRSVFVRSVLKYNLPTVRETPLNSANPHQLRATRAMLFYLIPPQCFSL